MIQHKQRGFTLIEMIGVLAVISILAAIVAPKIFDAIRDAKIDTLVTNVNTVRSAIVTYYKDTSTFPSHDADPTGANAAAGTVVKDLITAPVAPRALRGWQGPYLDKELENPINPDADFVIIDTANTAQVGPNAVPATVSFDIDGDGAADYSSVVNAANANAARAFVISYALVTGLTIDEAREISEILDSDMGDAAWFTSGRVRTPIGFDPTTAVNQANVSLWIYLGSR